MFATATLPSQIEGRILLSKGYRLVVQLLLVDVIPIPVKRTFALS
jgi:hypothetical protein